MNNLLTKIIFYFKKPKLIIVADKNPYLISNVIFQVLNPFLKITQTKKNTLKKILGSKALIMPFSENNDLSFFIEASDKPILVINDLQKPCDNAKHFKVLAKPGSYIAQIKKIAKDFSTHGCLLLNFDNQKIREIDNQNVSSVISFGFLKSADLNISDFNKDNGSNNFKINYQGNIVPIWLENIFKKSEIYAILTAIGCGLQLNINLVEISQSIKNLKSMAR